MDKKESGYKVALPGGGWSPVYKTMKKAMAVAVAIFNRNGVIVAVVAAEGA